VAVRGFFGLGSEGFSTPLTGVVADDNLDDNNDASAGSKGFAVLFKDVRLDEVLKAGATEDRLDNFDACAPAGRLIFFSLCESRFLEKLLRFLGRVRE